MGNRSKFIGLSAIGIAVAAARSRRRRRLRDVVQGFAAAIMPTRLPPAEGDTAVEDEAHAPGHRHLPIEQRPSRRLRDRIGSAQRRCHGHPHPES